MIIRDISGGAMKITKGPEAGHLVKHTFLGWVQQGVALGVGLVLLPYMVWQLGAEKYGVLLIVQLFSISGLLAYTDIGLYNASTRYLTQFYAQGNFSDFRNLLMTSFVIFLFIGTLCALFVFTFSELLFSRVFQIPQEYAEQSRIGLTIYAVSFLFNFPAFVLKAFYSSVQDLVTLRAWEIIERVVYGVVIFVFLIFSNSIVGFVIAEQVVGSIFLLIFVVVAASRYEGLFTLNPCYFSWSSLRNIWPLSWQVFLNRLFYVFYQKMPEIFVAYFLGVKDMAHFAIIKKIPTALKSLQAGANTAVFAAAAFWDSLGMQDKLCKLMLRSARYCYLFLTPVSAFIFVFSEEILRIWVGEEYVFLANVLRGYLSWQYVMFLVGLINAMLTRREQYVQVLPYNVVGGVVLIAVMVSTIGMFGLWSVIGGLLANGIVIAYGTVKVQQDWLKISYRELYRYVVAVPMVCAGVAGLGVFALTRVYIKPEGLVELMALFGCVCLGYVATVYRLGLDGNERQGLEKILRRVMKG